MAGTGGGEEQDRFGNRIAVTRFTTSDGNVAFRPHDGDGGFVRMADLGIVIDRCIDRAGANV